MDASLFRNLLLPALAGLVANILLRLLANALPTTGYDSHGRNWAVEWFLSFKLQFVFFLLVTLLAIYRRYKKDAKIYAFLAGMGLSYLVLHWLL